MARHTGLALVERAKRRLPARGLIAARRTSEIRIQVGTVAMFGVPFGCDQVSRRHVLRQRQPQASIAASLRPRLAWSLRPGSRRRSRTGPRHAASGSSTFCFCVTCSLPARAIARATPRILGIAARHPVSPEHKARATSDGQIEAPSGRPSSSSAMQLAMASLSGVAEGEAFAFIMERDPFTPAADLTPRASSHRAGRARGRPWGRCARCRPAPR